MTIEQRIAEILTAHQRHVIHEKNQMCLCGWGALGRSHPEHIAAVLVAELPLSRNPLLPGYEVWLVPTENEAQ